MGIFGSIYLDGRMLTDLKQQQAITYCQTRKKEKEVRPEANPANRAGHALNSTNGSNLTKKLKT